MKKNVLLSGLLVCLVLGLPLTSFGGTISSDWDDNTEVDLAGYNVYRSTATVQIKADGNPVILTSGAWELIAEGVTVSEYTDATVPDGMHVSYYVTAVDTDGNESRPSNISQKLLPPDKTPPTNPNNLTLP